MSSRRSSIEERIASLAIPDGEPTAERDRAPGAEFLRRVRGRRHARRVRAAAWTAAALVALPGAGLGVRLLLAPAATRAPEPPGPPGPIADGGSRPLPADARDFPLGTGGTFPSAFARATSALAAPSAAFTERWVPFAGVRPDSPQVADLIGS